MIKGKCIYCKEEKYLNREHAFPKSLLQEGAPGWVIDTHLCKSCNSHLGKLDVVLSRKSPLAYICERIQEGLGQKDKTLHSSVYNKRDVEVNPVRLFFSNPVYNDHILLHDFTVESDEKNAAEYTVRALQPQIILTLCTSEQSVREIIVKNREEFNAISLDWDFITDYNEQDDVYCIFGNTYIFPPKSANRFFAKKDEFKSKFIKDTPITQYTLLVLFPEEDKYQGKAQDFCDAFKGEAKDDIPAKKLQNPEVFTQTIQAIPDSKSIPEFLRAIAKTAFHCFLYHYPKFSGHESIFTEIRDFIYTETPNKFVAQCRNTETADLVYDSMEHLHVFYFFIQGNDIGCRIDFFTGLLPNQFSYEVTLAGNPGKSHPRCDGVAFIPFSVHPKSQLKKRIHSLTELGSIQKPRWNEGRLWLPGSERKNDAAFYNNRGIDYRKEGKLDLAIKDFDKAIELNPDFAEAYNNRGVAYGINGQVDNAIADFNKAVGLNPTYADAYCNRGNTYLLTGEIDKAIKDYSRSIKHAPKDAVSYSNRGVAYLRKGEVEKTIEDTSKAIELDERFSKAYYNRAEAWLRLKEWNEAKADLTTAKKLGMDIVAAFHDNYKNVETYFQWHRIRIPDDIAHMLTQPRRVRFPKQQKILSADGTPLESSDIMNLRDQLRNVGTSLGEYIKVKPSFGIKTSLTEAFVVDEATRNNLITAHPSSADILKPFLHGRDLRRWHAEPQEKWLIFAHRGITIDEYPAILKHLGNYRDVLSKRVGKQEWYELPISLDKSHRFSQPKLVCPNLYNHQTFSIDTAGFYCGDTCYLIPTEESWLCGLLNSRAVEWFYSQESNQLTIDYLRARSGYMQQIPVPEIKSTQKALIGKFVDYLIYLQQQPTINSRDLAYARDRVMLGYFERIIDGMVYESYLPDELHKGNKHFFQPLLDEQLPRLEEIQGDKMSAFRDIFEHLHERTHPIRKNLFFLDSIKPISIIEGKA